VRANCAIDPERIRLDLQFVQTESMAWIILSSKVVGKGACSQLGRRSDGARGIALLAREARRCSTVGALTAI
jgi:hypothetical protein